MGTQRKGQVAAVTLLESPEAKVRISGVLLAQHLRDMLCEKAIQTKLRNSITEATPYPRAECIFMNTHTARAKIGGYLRISHRHEQPQKPVTGHHSCCTPCACTSVAGTVLRPRSRQQECRSRGSGQSGADPESALGPLLGDQLVEDEAQLQGLGAEHVRHHRPQHLPPPCAQLRGQRDTCLAGG